MSRTARLWVAVRNTGCHCRAEDRRLKMQIEANRDLSTLLAFD